MVRSEKESGVNVDVVLSSSRGVIVDEAYAALERAQTVHYEALGEPVTRQRLTELFDLVVRAIHDRDLGPVVRAGERIAEERFHAGFDISEVQTAFNALEEAMWRRVVAAEPPDELAECIGLVSTVLGVAKDSLARTYVSLASHRHVPSLDLSALFEGATS
jgi:hypothetical protein